MPCWRRTTWSTASTLKKHNNEASQTELAVAYMEDYYGELALNFGPPKLKAVRQLMLNIVSESTGKPLSRAYIKWNLWWHPLLIRQFR